MSNVKMNLPSNSSAEEADLLAATLDAMDEGLMAHDADGRLRIVNRRAIELLNLPPELSQVGARHEDIVRYLAVQEKIEDGGQPVRSQLARTLAAGENFEFVRLLQNGSVLNIACKPMADGGWLTTFRDITSERDAATKLRHSEERYRSIADSQSEAVCRWRSDGLLTFVNEVYCRLAGYSQSSISGQKVGTLIHPDDRQDVMVQLNSLGPDKSYVEIKNRVVDKNGAVRWMVWTANVFLDSNDNILGYQASGHEITDRIVAEEAALEAERQLRLVIDALPVCIAYIRADGRYEMVNETYEKWFGKTREDIVGEHAKNIIGREAYDSLRDQMKIALSGRAATFEGSVPYKNAGERFVQWSYVPNFASDGTVHGFFSVVTDLSEHRRTTQALKESQDRFQRMIESSPDIILVHHEGRILFVNTAAASQLRAKKTDLLGHDIGEFFDREYSDLPLQITAPNNEHDAPALFEELMMKRGDGTSFTVELAGIHLVYEGKPAVQLICRNITARNSAQAQLIQTSKLASLGEIAASMAHELAQPLNVIRMAADNGMFAIEENENKDHDIEFHQRQFETVAGQTVRMAEIIDHMRDFARIDNERAIPLDPLKTIQRSGDFFTEMFRSENIRLNFSFLEHPIKIRGQKILLEQLFVSLIQNAHDAILMRRAQSDKTLAEGRIDITAELHEDKKSVRICVADNGGGVPSAVIDRIFDPFITTKPAGRGTGLGLSIAREIVSRMDGEISVKNGPDGALFFIDLQLIDNSESEPL